MEDDMWREVSNPYAAIGWIREELNNLLRQVRIGLEAAADENDLSLLENAESALDKLHLTLEMLRSPGASLLANEMRELLGSLRAEEIDETENALIALMQGLVIQDTYLDRLQAGGSDMPLLLLPTLNDLRAVRNQPLLSEGVLFTPNLSAVSNNKIPGSDQPTTDINTAATKWHAAFFAGYADYLKNPKDSTQADKLSKLSSEIQASVGSIEQRRLWWIAAAVFDGIQSGALAGNISLHSLFERLQQQLADLAQGSTDSSQADSLATALLYYLAIAKKGNVQIDKINKLYQLDTLVMDPTELERVRSGISGHNRKLFDSLSKAIGDEFEIIKTRLAEMEEGIAPEEADDSGFTIDELMDRLADTLKVLGLQQSADSLHQSSRILSTARKSGEKPTDADLVQVAGDILSIENLLDSHANTLGSARESTASGSETPQLPAHELWQMIGKLLDECLTLLGNIKDQINDWLSGELSADNYADIGQDFEQLVGALDLANHKPATNATRRLQTITAGLLEQKELPPEDIQDLFADAFAALEMFLAAARDQQPQSADLLKLMLQRLDSLESGPDASAEITRLPEQKAIQKPVEESKALVDDDILEIFMEEYDEVYATIKVTLPQWLADTTNTEARTEVRRSFHTLKGSGRMVGADEIGEFSWKVEMLLNQVIEGEREADNPLLQTVAVASAMLPALKDRLQGNNSTIEPQLLDQFSKLLDQLGANHVGTAEKLSTLIENLPEEFKLWLSDDIIVKAEPLIDPELAVLIREEVAEHLATLKNWLANAVGTIPGKEPIRAAHTIAGTMALAPGENDTNLESKLAHETEHLLNRCLTAEIPLKDSATAVINGVINQVTTRLATLEKVVEPVSVKTHPLFTQLAKLNMEVHDEILERTEAVKARKAKAAAEKAAAEKAAAEKAAAEKAAAEKAAAEKAAAEKAAAEKAAAEKAAAEKVAAEKAAAEKAAAEKAAAEKVAAEKAAAEKAAAQKVAAEKAAAEKATAQKAAAEKAAAEKAAAEKAAAEKAAAQKVAAEKVAAEKVAAEKAAAEKAAAEKAAAEKAAA
ncbi:MAG: Hpt domain-containing protein, partial [Proteobacteria bacterium]|nr:Hpt domain-containing protein [Pseudomonadota bacterium]